MNKNVQMQNILFFILIAVMGIYIYKCYNDKIGNSRRSKQHYESKRDVIEFYGRKTCPFTVQMIKMLEGDSHFKYIELDGTTKKEVPAVPYFYNPANGKEVVGAQESKAALMAKLR